MALLSRCAVALVCLAWGCADARVGDLQLQHQEEAAPPSPREGWAFASRDSSRFDNGTLVYGEFHAGEDTLGILELDLPQGDGGAPKLRYQERRAGRVTFDGLAVTGSVTIPRDLLAEDCACSVIDFALRFESASGERRSLDRARVVLAGGHCGSTVQLADIDPDAEVEVRFVAQCLASTTAANAGAAYSTESRNVSEDPPSTNTVLLVSTTEPSDGCTYGGDPYTDANSDLGCDTQSESTSSAGCEADDTSSAGGCEADDTSSSSGCESDTRSASGDGSAGCESDDSQADACESDTLAWLPQLRRRRPPGALDAQERSGVTVALALLVPWWRGRRRR